MSDIISVENITKSFVLTKKQMKQKALDTNRLVAVDNLSFSLQKGELFGLLGSNGAGKTTTLRLLSGMLSPDKGKIIVDGRDIHENLYAYKKQMGFLTNELKFDGYFTPDYLYDYFSGLYNIDSESANKRKSMLFEKFGISSFSHLKINELSTGMKQKVSLVLSIVHDPQIIIYDEPTNGLDIIAAKVVEDYLQELHAEEKTIILSTHILSLAQKLCDRILIIKDGKALCGGNIKSICATQSLDDYFFTNYK